MNTFELCTFRRNMKVLKDYNKAVFIHLTSIEPVLQCVVTQCYFFIKCTSNMFVTGYRKYSALSGGMECGK